MFSFFFYSSPRLLKFSRPFQQFCLFFSRPIIFCHDSVKNRLGGRMWMGRVSFGCFLSLQISSPFSEFRSSKSDDDTKCARKTRRCTVFYFRASFFLVFVRGTTPLVADVPLETSTLLKKKERKNERGLNMMMATIISCMVSCTTWLVGPEACAGREKMDPAGMLPPAVVTIQLFFTQPCFCLLTLFKLCLMEVGAFVNYRSYLNC